MKAIVKNDPEGRWYKVIKLVSETKADRRVLRVMKRRNPIGIFWATEKGLVQVLAKPVKRKI